MSISSRVPKVGVKFHRYVIGLNLQTCSCFSLLAKVIDMQVVTMKRLNFLEATEIGLGPGNGDRIPFEAT